MSDQGDGEKVVYPQLYSNADIIKALEVNNGLVYLAARGLGCDPDTIYRRAKRCSAIRDAIKRKRGEFIDTAESKLAEAVMRGEPWAVTLALKGLGKDRGYSERSEVTGANGGPVDSVHFYIPQNGR